MWVQSLCWIEKTHWKLNSATIESTPSYKLPCLQLGSVGSRRLCQTWTQPSAPNKWNWLIVLFLRFANPCLLARECTSNTAHENTKMYISDSEIEDEVIHLFLYNGEKPIVFSNQYKAQKEANIPLIEYLYWMLKLAEIDSRQRRLAKGSNFSSYKCCFKVLHICLNIDFRAVCAYIPHRKCHACF